jgi:hypothetical protein
MPLHEHRKEVPMRSLGKIVEKGPSRVRGTGKFFTKRRRSQFMKERIGEKRWGSGFSKHEYNVLHREIKKERYNAKTEDARKKADEDLKLLEGLEDPGKPKIRNTPKSKNT